MLRAKDSAWPIISYCPDGPLPPETDPEVPKEPDGIVLEVSFDTGYSYHHDAARCGDLHAWLVTELGKWLDERNVPWCWLREDTGEWFLNSEGIDQLGNPKVGALR